MWGEGVRAGLTLLHVVCLIRIMYPRGGGRAGVGVGRWACRPHPTSCCVPDPYNVSSGRGEGGCRGGAVGVQASPYFVLCAGSV